MGRRALVNNRQSNFLMATDAVDFFLSKEETVRGYSSNISLLYPSLQICRICKVSHQRMTFTNQRILPDSFISGDHTNT